MGFLLGFPSDDEESEHQMEEFVEEEVPSENDGALVNEQRTEQYESYEELPVYMIPLPPPVDELFGDDNTDPFLNHQNLIDYIVDPSDYEDSQQVPGIPLRSPNVMATLREAEVYHSHQEKPVVKAVESKPAEVMPNSLVRVLHELQTEVSKIRSDVHSIVQFISPTSDGERPIVKKDLEKLVVKDDLSSLARKEDLERNVFTREEWSQMQKKFEALEELSQDVREYLQNSDLILTDHKSLLEQLEMYEIRAQDERYQTFQAYEKMIKAEKDLKGVYNAIKDYITLKTGDLEKERNLVKLIETVTSSQGDRAAHTLGELGTASRSEEFEKGVRSARATLAGLERAAVRREQQKSLEAERKSFSTNQSTKMCFVCEREGHGPSMCPTYPNYELRSELFRRTGRCTSCGLNTCRGFKKSCPLGRAKCVRCAAGPDGVSSRHHESLCPKRFPTLDWHPKSLDDIISIPVAPSYQFEMSDHRAGMLGTGRPSSTRTPRTHKPQVDQFSRFNAGAGPSNY